MVSDNPVVANGSIKIGLHDVDANSLHTVTVPTFNGRLNFQAAVEGFVPLAPARDEFNLAEWDELGDVALIDLVARLSRKWIHDEAIGNRLW